MYLHCCRHTGSSDTWTTLQCLHSDSYTHTRTQTARPSIRKRVTKIIRSQDSMGDQTGTLDNHPFTQLVPFIPPFSQTTLTTPFPNLWFLPSTFYNKSCANALLWYPITSPYPLAVTPQSVGDLRTASPRDPQWSMSLPAHGADTLLGCQVRNSCLWLDNWDSLTYHCSSCVYGEGRGGAPAYHYAS